MEGNSNSTPSSISRAGLGYGIGIAVGIVILVSVVKLVYYAFVRVQGRTQFGRARGNATVTAQEQNRSAVAVAVPGLDQAILDLYPKFEYSEEEKKKNGGEHQSGCSICLGDYKDSDLLRMLPDCGHTFHVTCIDAWMKLHATCPMCRTSPLPSPLSTPMSEMVPPSRHTMPIYR